MVSVLCSHQCFDSGNCVQEGYPGHKIPCDSNPKSFSSGSNQMEAEDLRGNWVIDQDPPGKMAVRWM